MSFNVGETIGPYCIIEQLGQGGMATVYKAYHASLDRYVALKVLHPAFNEDPNFEARFQREARLVANLEHPNIVPVYDYAEHENRPYLVMKYIEGETLKAHLSNGSLTSDEINKVVDAVGAALAHAHKKGILHRDIKPSNVLLAADGQTYLADFGLARIAQSAESTLSSDMIMGTPQYISPEQALGKKDLDEGTDIYSFGVMLYEMAVGQVPFSADTPFSVIHDHIYSPLPPPHTINPNVPETVERVLLKALAKDRADRYEDVGAMVKAFKDAWQEAGVSMQGTSVTLPKSPVPVDPTAAKKVKTAQKTSLAKAAEAVENPKKKRSPWMFVGISLVVIACCGFLAFARANRLFALNKGNATEVPTSIILTATKPAVNTPLPPAQGQPQLPPEVLAAQQHAKDNPKDPNAQLALALAFFDARMSQRSYETLVHASDVAGQNEAFFVHAAEEYRGRDAWVATAAMYLRAVKLHGLNGPVPDGLNHAFHEAVYKAADHPELPALLPFNSLAEVDQPISLIAQARHSFYTGKLDDARIFLNQAKRLDPDMPEAFLLEAEFDSLQVKPEEAKLIFNGLVTNLSTPEWIRIMAQELLNRIP